MNVDQKLFARSKLLRILLYAIILYLISFKILYIYIMNLLFIFTVLRYSENYVSYIS